MKDPEWGTLDTDTRQQIIALSFEEEIVADPGWSGLSLQDKDSIKKSYFNDAANAEDALPVPPAPPRTIGGTISDVGVSAAKGVVGLGEAAVGLADIPTFGNVGKGMEQYLGYDPEDTQNFLESLYSDAQQAANRRVDRAEGFLETTKESLLNPSTIVHSAIESAPSMMGGAGFARKLIAVAPKVAPLLVDKIGKSLPLLAGAIGEGLISAGSSAEGMRQQTENGLLTPTQSAIAIASGIGTSAIAIAGGRLAQKVGLDDVDTLLAGGKSTATSRGVAGRIIGGGITEAVFEELPQSMQEQIWLNAALDKPLFEGVPEAGSTGMLTGFVMGGGANVLRGKAEVETGDKPPGPTVLEVDNQGLPIVDDIMGSTDADMAIAAFNETMGEMPAREPKLTDIAWYDIEPPPGQQLDDITFRSTLAKIGLSLPDLAGKSAEESVAIFNAAQAEQIRKDFFGRPTTYADEAAIARDEQRAAEQADIEDQQRREEIAAWQAKKAGLEETPGFLSSEPEPEPDRTEYWKRVRAKFDLGLSKAEAMAEEDAEMERRADLGRGGGIAFGDEATASAAIEEEANQAATSLQNDLPEPTEAQKKAGVYKKGHITLFGKPVAIENPRGSKREGVDPDGKPWSVEMKHHYGYWNRTEGKDGDQIDVIIGPYVGSKKVYVVDQRDPKTLKFDEHKTLAGFRSEEEAREGYLANYELGWNGLGAITEMSVPEFKEWLGDGTRTKKAVSYVEPEGVPESDIIEEAEAKGVEADDVQPEAGEGVEGEVGEGDAESETDEEKRIYAEKPKPLPKSKEGDLAAKAAHDEAMRAWVRRYRAAVKKASPAPETAKVAPEVEEEAKEPGIQPYNIPKKVYDKKFRLVEVEAVIEDGKRSGETVVIQKDADEVLAAIDAKKSVYEQLINCLGA